MTADARAILIAAEAPSGALRTLVDRLASIGIDVTVVDEMGAAAELFARLDPPPAVLLDMRDSASAEVEDLKAAVDPIRRTLSALPAALPVVVTVDASPPLVVACLRAGAGDLIDLQLEGTATARAVVHRITQRQAERARELAVIEQQRQMIEDLLKDLIRTERRSIDVEEQLLARTRTGDLLASGLEVRPPAVLVVEHERAVADELADRLEEAGVATYAYVTGEEAVREAETLATGLDLALVAAQLPGIDGLETIRRIRIRIPRLPAFLVSSVVDADLAARAANLGVVGFLQKPLTDIDQLVDRLVELAREALGRTREHVYLQRIKERHERVLARYRALPQKP